jgi:hypothetical protein
MTTTPEKRPAPEPRFKVMINGEERTLFMSFGLLNEICRAIGGLEAAIQIPVDNELRDYSLLAVLSKRDELGAVAEGGAVNLRTLDIAVEDVEELLAWITDHVTDFFLRTMERVVKGQQKNAERFQALAKSKPESSPPTPTGSAA